MSKMRRLGKNFIFLTVGNFASRLLSFIFVPFYTSVLSTEEYGTADLISTTVTLLFPFFTLIICEAIMRFAQDEDIDNEQIHTISVVVWSIGFALLLCLSPIIHFIKPLKEYYVLIILYYFTYSLHTNTGYFVRGIEKVKVYSIAGVISTLLTVSLNVLFLLCFKTGISGYLLSYIIASFIATIYMYVAAGIYKFKLHFKDLDRTLLRKMLKYSLPMIPNSASWWVSNSSDRYMLIYFIGVSINGIYSVAYKIPSIISTVTSLFVMAWRISAVEDFGTEESRKFYSQVFDLYITITALMTSGLLLINKPLSHLLYAKDFYQAWRYVPLLLVASSFHSFSDYFGTIYTSAYRTKMLFYSTIAGAVGNVCLNLILIPKYGAYGAAFATLCSYIIVWVIRLVNSRKIMKLDYDVLGDILCACVIAIQTFIASKEYQHESFYSIILLCTLIVMRRKSIIKLLKMLLRINDNKADKTKRVNVSSDLSLKLEKEYEDINAYYGGYTCDDKLTQSASGGAASIISEYVLDRGGVVFGVRYTSDFKDAQYCRIDNKMDLYKIKDTKYIPASKRMIVDNCEIDLHTAVHNALRNGQTVLVVGLGCEISGLVNSCTHKNIDVDKLITVDLICHGPTQTIMQKQYIEQLEKRFKSQITEFSIRNKERGWALPNVYATFANGKSYKRPWNETDLSYAFGHSSRQGCNDCRFKGHNHVADITIGDYWGITEDIEGYNENGVSVFLARTEKGKILARDIYEQSSAGNGYAIYPGNTGHIIANNPMFYLSRQKNASSNVFLDNVKSKGLHRAVIIDMGLTKYLYSRLRMLLAKI